MIEQRADGAKIHHCDAETVDWFSAAMHEDLYVSFGALLDDLKEDMPVIKEANDPVWMLSVNGGEYRGPIRFCPFCGEKLP